MYKLALVNKQTNIDEKFLIIFYVTTAEFMDNYWKAFSQTMNLRLEVVSEDITYLPFCEWPIYLCSLKTFWLNVFKRKWRKKHALIMKRKNFKELMKRQISGKLIN